MMENKFLTVCVLFLFILSTFTSGCTDKSYEDFYQGYEGITDEPFSDTTMFCYEQSGNVECAITYNLYNYFEIDSADLTRSGNQFEVDFRLMSIAGVRSPRQEWETTVFVLGKLEEFEENKIYTVNFENGTEIGTFLFENGELYTFIPAKVSGIKITEEDAK